MIRDFDGAAVLDAQGEKIGTVERSYDDASGAVRYIEVKIGSLFGKHRLVPVGSTETTDQGLQVPYSKKDIEDSPDASSIGDELQGDLLEEVRSYYSGVDEAASQITAVPARPADDGDAE